MHPGSSPYVVGLVGEARVLYHTYVEVEVEVRGVELRGVEVRGVDRLIDDKMIFTEWGSKNDKGGKSRGVVEEENGRKVIKKTGGRVSGRKVEERMEKEREVEEREVEGSREGWKRRER